jgi:hypothetical protein
MLSLGIVGLPNVGKSTLFNALTSARVDAANYPFSTRKANVALVEVPDERLQRLAELVRPKKVTSATVQFVDIAGLAKGAAQGEGLGNLFLAAVREADALVHVVRCFEDPDVTHPLGAVDPVRDREVVEFELALADLATVEKRLDRVRRSARVGESDAAAELPVLERAHTALSNGTPLWHVPLDPAERRLLRPLTLLTVKPILYVANVDDAALAGDAGPHEQALRAAVDASHEPAEVVRCAARFEAELAELSPGERVEFLHSVGVETGGLARLIRAGYHLLGLQTFFTTGEKEVRAWTIHRGDTAPVAAGVIHTDFERGFIRAETVSYDEFVVSGGLKQARDRGLVRSEGRDYVVRDGDVILFRFNV